MRLSLSAPIDPVHLDMKVRIAIAAIQRKQYYKRTQEPEGMYNEIQSPSSSETLSDKADNVRITVLEMQLQESWRVVRRMRTELRNREAMEYNRMVDKFAFLRPLRDLETNRLVANFPSSVFAMHQMDEAEIDQLLIDLRVDHGITFMDLAAKCDHLEAFVKGRKMLWV